MRIILLAAALVALALSANAQRQQQCETWCNGPPGYQTCYTRCW